MESPQKHFGSGTLAFDVYSLFWLVLFLILAALGRFYLPLFLPAAVVLVYLLIRLFSKNQQKRQVENARFIALFRSIFRWFRGRKVLQTDKVLLFQVSHLRSVHAPAPGTGQGGDHLPVLRLSV